MERIEVNVCPENYLKDSLAPYAEQLHNHTIYSKLNNLDDIRIFMQFHVFAVWDFMSLVKALQRHLAPSYNPWFPPKDMQSARFINDIVLAEESDIDINGDFSSHFQMYQDAMEEIGANKHPITSFLELVSKKKPIGKVLSESNLLPELKSFLKCTFDIIDSDKPHTIAAAFSFGREDVIPEMFLSILKSNNHLDSCPKFKYYLERHIELDGDEHGPMAMQLIKSLCGSDIRKWKEASKAAKEALDSRIRLWSLIERMISQNGGQ